MLNQFSRTELIFGKSAIEKLQKSRVAVFGIGGVGGYVVEALTRSGIGTLDIIDNDTVSLTNLNRQIIANHKTIGRLKVDVAEERIHDICPDVKVNKFACFFLPETADRFNFCDYDYIVDAIDTVKGKLALAEHAQKCNVPIISSMGAGNKVKPELFKVADIYKTKVCPLAKVMRTELRKRGIKKLKVVYSEETPVKPIKSIDAESECKEGAPGRALPGSTAFVPAVAGLIIAGEVIKDLAEYTDEK